ncbi:MAG: hypothetical protein AAGK37_20815 [Pseudomonadota bacterium]
MIWLTVPLISGFFTAAIASDGRQDYAICGVLDTSEPSDLKRAVECVSNLAEELGIRECVHFDATNPRGLLQLGVCGARLAAEYDRVSNEFAAANIAHGQTIDRKDNEINLLRGSILGVKISSWHTFATGEYDRGTAIRPRHYCGHNVDAEARRLCGVAEANLKQLSSRAGDKCGYNDYVVACISR